MENAVVACGADSMTSVPMAYTGDVPPKCQGTAIREKGPDMHTAMSVTGENVAARHGVPRKEMETLAVDSHKRAAAQDAGKFDVVTIPVPGVDEEGNPITFSKGQGIRRGTSMEFPAQFRFCLKADRAVTAVSPPRPAAEPAL